MAPKPKRTPDLAKITQDRRAAASRKAKRIFEEISRSVKLQKDVEDRVGMSKIGTEEEAQCREPS